MHWGQQVQFLRPTWCMGEDAVGKEDVNVTSILTLKICMVCEWCMNERSFVFSLCNSKMFEKQNK